MLWCDKMYKNISKKLLHLTIEFFLVRLLDNSKCILFIRGERPVVDYKYNLLKHPNIRCTEDGGAAPYDYTAADNALDDLSGTPENYELLDMDDFLPAEAAEMKPTIQRIRRST